MLFRYGSDLYNKARIANNLLGIVDHMNSLVCFMFSFTEAEMLYGAMTICPLFFLLIGKKFSLYWPKV